jgi:hypothetical protein
MVFPRQKREGYAAMEGKEKEEKGGEDIHAVPSPPVLPLVG